MRWTGANLQLNGGVLRNVRRENREYLTILRIVSVVYRYQFWSYEAREPEDLSRICVVRET